MLCSKVKTMRNVQITLTDNIQITSTPREYVLAGIWVDHGAKLGDHNAVGLSVPPVGVALQKLAPVGHLT